VTLSWAGDPASCSRLGGALRTTAARLGDSALDLDPGCPQRLLLDEVYPRLDTTGSKLQVHAQELAELAVSTRRLEEQVTEAGLQLEGLRVLEPMGVIDVRDAERRIRARPSLQAQADRIAARLGRCRTDLVRHLQAVCRDLERLTPDAASRHEGNG
jgi:hypothetical protein